MLVINVHSLLPRYRNLVFFVLSFVWTWKYISYPLWTNHTINMVVTNDNLQFFWNQVTIYNPKSMDLSKGKMRNLVYPIFGLFWSWNRHIFHSELSHIINNVWTNKQCDQTHYVFWETYFWWSKASDTYASIHNKMGKKYFLLWTSFEFENANICP